MLDLDNIMKMWKEDSVIDQNNLDEASIQTPMLHAKYLELYNVAKIKLRRAEADQKVLLRDKWSWYNGKMSKEQIDEKGWDYDPLNGLKVLKGDMDYFYDSDPDIRASEDKVVYWRTVNECLKEIIDNIKWRSNTIKNIIDWRRFESGG